MFLHKFFLSALFSQMHSDTIKVIFVSFSYCTKIIFAFLELLATNRSLQDIISHIFVSILLHSKKTCTFWYTPSYICLNIYCFLFQIPLRAQDAMYLHLIYNRKLIHNLFKILVSTFLAQSIQQRVQIIKHYVLSYMPMRQ